MGDPHNKLKRHVEAIAECMVWALRTQDALKAAPRQTNVSSALGAIWMLPKRTIRDYMRKNQGVLQVEHE